MIMNLKLKLAVFFFFFFASTSAFAQYGYGYPYSPGGVDRSIGRVPTPARAKDKEKKKEPDYVELTVQYLDKKLNLDDFQAAAITTVYNEHKAEIIMISGADEPLDVKKKKMNELTEKVDARIIPLLSKEQVEKYQKMIAERKQ